MKKITLFATTFMLFLGMASIASAAAFTSTATTNLNGINFTPSTNVTLDTVSTATAWAAASKHITGGTTQYGLLSSSTNMQMKLDLAKDAAPTNQASAITLAGF